MLYLDDVAVWLHTQKGSILRGALCGAVLVGSVALGLATWGRRDEQAAEIEKNRITIAECRYNLDAINKKISGFDANADLVYYSPRGVAEPVAALQSRYGGYSDGVSVEAIKSDAEAIRQEMADYIEASASESPWFPSVTTAYEWTYPMQEESIVQKMPVVFECRDRRSGELLGVVTGMYDGGEERCGDFAVYQTMAGYYEINGAEDGGQQALESEVEDIIGTVSGNTLTGDAATDNEAIVDGVTNPELETEGEDGMESDTEDAGEADTGASKVTKKLDNDEILSSVLKKDENAKAAEQKDKLNEAQKGGNDDGKK